MTTSLSPEALSSVLGMLDRDIDVLSRAEGVFESGQYRSGQPAAKRAFDRQIERVPYLHARVRERAEALGSVAAGLRDTIESLRRDRAYVARHQRMPANAWVPMGDPASSRAANPFLDTSAEGWPGLSRGRPLSSFPHGELARGAKHEEEHFGKNYPSVAARVAADHLVEDPKYYEHMEGRKGRKPNPTPRLPAGVSPLRKVTPNGLHEYARSRPRVYWYSLGKDHRGVSIREHGLQKVVHALLRAGGTVEPYEVEWPDVMNQGGYSVYLVLSPRDTAEKILREHGFSEQDANHSWGTSTRFGNPCGCEGRASNPITLSREVRLQTALLLPKKFKGRADLEKQAAYDDVALAKLRKTLGIAGADEELSEARREHQESVLVKSMIYAKEPTPAFELLQMTPEQRVRWAVQRPDDFLAMMLAAEEVTARRKLRLDREYQRKNRDPILQRGPRHAAHAILKKRFWEIVNKQIFRTTKHGHKETMEIVPAGSEGAVATVKNVWPETVGLSRSYSKSPIPTSNHRWLVSEVFLSPEVQKLNGGAKRGTIYLRPDLRVVQGRGSGLNVETKTARGGWS